MAQRSADEHRSAVDLGRGQRRPSAITGRRSGAAGRWWLLNGRWRLVIEISGLAISETCLPGEGDHFRVNEDGAVQGLWSTVTLRAVGAWTTCQVVSTGGDGWQRSCCFAAAWRGWSNSQDLWIKIF